MGLRLEDVVERKVVTVSPEDSARTATDLMEEHSTSCLVVTVEDRIEGILTSRDVIQRVVARSLDPSRTSVREIASHPVIVLKPETFLGEAIKMMLQKSIKKVPLVDDDGRLVGLVSISDFVEFHSELFSTIWEQIIMTEPVTATEESVFVAL